MAVINFLDSLTLRQKDKKSYKLKQLCFDPLERYINATQYIDRYSYIINDLSYNFINRQDINQEIAKYEQKIELKKIYREKVLQEDLRSLSSEDLMLLYS